MPTVLTAYGSTTTYCRPYRRGCGSTARPWRRGSPGGGRGPRQERHDRRIRRHERRLYPTSGGRGGSGRYLLGEAAEREVAQK